ncbi:MAG: hypothetical protein NC205_07800 [Prevotella sp.]|nr:hypothetical protein [Alistipes senegalensis]MCM1358484.1 hypothetical protein [Prevotella sp.]MCM1474045.1 hypothetical protein [Muribaculaceae bacterium]
MGKEYYCFENETGDTGFLAGVVDVLTCNLPLCDFYYAFEADIFRIEDNDISDINNTIKKRLNYYNKRDGINLPEEYINGLNLQLEKVNTDDEKILCDTISQYSSEKDIPEKVGEFFRQLNWYLQEPTGIYVDKSFNHKNVEILGRVYLYMGFKYFFIAYDEWAVLFIVGTVE